MKIARDGPGLVPFVLLGVAAGAFASATVVRGATPASTDFGMCSVVKYFDSAATQQRRTDVMRAAGIEFVRTDFQWRSVESARGTYNFTSLDTMVGLAEQNGLALLGLISHTPSWAAPITDHLDEWLAFVETTVRRYPQVRYWEVFNEPDLASFWGSTPDPVGYARLLRLTYARIKAIDSTLFVVSGGISSGGNNIEGGYNGKYVEPMFAAGIAGSFDAFGIHPYRQPHAPEESLYEANTSFPRKRTLEEMIAKYRALLDQHGCGDKPIWITECGYPAVPGTNGDHKGTDPNLGVSDEDQARFLPRCILLALQYGVSNWMWFSTQSLERDPMDREHWFGIIHPDYSPRPAYHALKTLRRAFPPGSVLLRDRHVKSPFYRTAWRRPDGQTVCALWLGERGAQALCDLTIVGDVSEAYDVYGNPITLRVTNLRAQATLSGDIIYIVGPDSVDARDVFAPTMFSMQPESRTVAAGGSADFSVAIAAQSAASVSYRWYKDGQPVVGATAATLTVDSLTEAHAGDYVTLVSVDGRTMASEPARLRVAPPEPGRLVNLSVRCWAGKGETVAIAGFVVADGPADVLVRGIGPGLVTFDVPERLADPVVTVFSGANAIGGNDNWSGDGGGPALIEVFHRCGAFDLAVSSQDAAMVMRAGGLHTAHVTGVGDGTGIALLEIYEASRGAGRLVNLSGRAEASGGHKAIIAGFVIDGNVPRRVLIRAAGPSLAPFELTQVLAEPALRLLNSKGELIAANKHWSAGADASAVAAAATSTGAFPFRAGALDAALLRTLAPGLYTAHVSADSGTGVALVEVYEVL
ncbi:MAG: cellulase family glycosylhydrolase [Opitutaceae bacterium]|nr:cellulase family glycosylhydrolase [Opitutaceae bacterium]